MGAGFAGKNHVISSATHACGAASLSPHPGQPGARQNHKNNRFRDDPGQD
jgi:hypothetical protein